ncbi:protein IN2-1 homolog B-like isoform X2 [Tasmannia lanceolata]|uniref:protein IN2-1 homolog B-like isoform X2 n=1 Tax=Tasmannia lanceolata TaxID=3420 RepID=UPI0040641030
MALVFSHSSFVTSQGEFSKFIFPSKRKSIKPILHPPSKSLKPFPKAMATLIVQELLPPVLDSSSEPPPLFDGTTRLYISYKCPFAQRVWIARNYKGLRDIVKLVPIDLQNRPAWYKEKVYPANKVPSLEHNNEVRGESLDLVKFIDSHFEGPPLLPDNPAKKEFAEELLSYCDTFNTSVRKAFSSKGDVEKEISASLDYLESALSKFDDGPFFLGQFSLEMNKIKAYTQTRRDPQELLEDYKKRFSAM